MSLSPAPWSPPCPPHAGFSSFGNALQRGKANDTRPWVVEAPSKGHLDNTVATCGRKKLKVSTYGKGGGTKGKPRKPPNSKRHTTGAISHLSPPSFFNFSRRAYKKKTATAPFLSFHVVLTKHSRLLIRFTFDVFQCGR